MSHSSHRRCVLAALALAAAIAPTASLAQQTEEVITLYNFPADMVKLDTSSAGWSAPSYSSNGVPAVSRKALPLQTCGRPADVIDLARVRANGFRLIDTHVNGNFGPEGYKMTGESIVRLYQRNGTRLTNAPRAADTDAISISPSVWALDIPVRGKLQRLGCSATWGLVIRVVGPKGVDPYRKVAPIARPPVGSRSMKELRK